MLKALQTLLKDDIIIKKYWRIKRMGTTQQLTKKEHDLLVLCILNECIELARKEDKSFEEVLNEDVFAKKANTGFAEAVCNSIKALQEEGYIKGTVLIEYEQEIDMETFEEESTNAIDFSMCTFHNISITAKGKIWLSIEGFKEVTKEFAEKAKPVIKCIAKTALQTAVEVAVTTGMKAVGFFV